MNNNEFTTKKISDFTIKELGLITNSVMASSHFFGDSIDNDKGIYFELFDYKTLIKIKVNYVVEIEVNEFNGLADNKNVWSSDTSDLNKNKSIKDFFTAIDDIIFELNKYKINYV